MKSQDQVTIFEQLIQNSQFTSFNSLNTILKNNLLNKCKILLFRFLIYFTAMSLQEFFFSDNNELYRVILSFCTFQIS
jgi:hypothetical protein